MTTRKQTRDALLGAKEEFKAEVVEFNGVKVEIRQPSYKARREIMKRARDGDNIDPFEFLVWAVIENTYVESGDEKVFEDTDYEALVSRPVGGFIDKFGEKASELMNLEQDIEERIKN